MRMTTIARGVLAAAVATGLVVAGATAPAMAAETDTPGFRGDWYPTDWETGEALPLNTVFDWDDVVPAATTAAGSLFDIDDPAERFPFSKDVINGEQHTTGAWLFISPRGKETSPSDWNALEPLVLRAPGAPGIWLPTMKPEGLTVLGDGNPSGTMAVKAVGGEYSFGIAFTQYNGVRVSQDGVFFQHITVEPGNTGKWTIDPVVRPAGHEWGTALGQWDQSLFNTAGGWVASDSGPVDPDQETAEAQIRAQVTESVTSDGPLELVAPFTEPVVLGNATLENNRSVSTGTLGQVEVRDARALSRPGWTLTTAVDDFVREGGSESIAKSHFGIKPRVVSGTGVTAGAEQVAGSATYGSTFAEGAAGSFGTSVLNADLRFLAPEFAPAGTYTSTLTLTLVSR